MATGAVSRWYHSQAISIGLVVFGFMALFVI